MGELVETVDTKTHAMKTGEDITEDIFMTGSGCQKLKLIYDKLDENNEVFSLVLKFVA